jgi:hypothetical protein
MKLTFVTDRSIESIYLFSILQPRKSRVLSMALRIATSLTVPTVMLTLIVRPETAAKQANSPVPSFDE